MFKPLLTLVLLSALAGCGSEDQQPDSDGDGVIDSIDQFPQDPREFIDSDGDGVGDNEDAFPKDASETHDRDGDRIGDNSDVFPSDPNEWLDTDNDGTGDNADDFPNDPNEHLDSDKDGVGDNTDAFPNDPNEIKDTDGDGIGDNSDPRPDDPVVDPDLSNIELGTRIGNDFQSGKLDINLGHEQTLPGGGSVVVRVDIADTSLANQPHLEPTKVYFVSACEQVGLAEFTPNQVTAAGEAAVIYQDKGCGKEHGETDLLVAYIGIKQADGSIVEVASATGEISVEPIRIGSIQFQEASQNPIAIDGYGTASTPSITQLTYLVLDTFGNPMPGRNVNLELERNLAYSQLSSASTITDHNGVAETILQSGLAAGTMRVKGSVNNYDAFGNKLETLTTLSTPISINTPFSTPENINLTASSYNPHSWDKTGEEVIITVIASDKNGNSILDGTTIYFRATGGDISQSCVTENGRCSVTWTGGHPRPVDGQITIFAHTQGQGNFQDINSNGLLDHGEIYTTYAEPWVDNNGNGSYEETGDYQPDLDIDDDGSNEFNWSFFGLYFEDYIDSNANNQFDPIAGDKYQGGNCAADALENGHCAERLTAGTSIRLQMSAGNDLLSEGPFIFDTDEFDYSQTPTCIDGRSGNKTIRWRLADSSDRRNSLPEGTTIEAEPTNVDITNSNGLGSVQSKVPVNALPLWESNNMHLTPAERKQTYLNLRGNIVDMVVGLPEVLPGVEYGTVRLKVSTLDGQVRYSNELKVDILGNTCPEI